MSKKYNLLYITNLSGNTNAGPTYSVPKQINAQKKYDNVYWINSTNSELEEWKNTKVFHTFKEIGFKKLSDLPTPFNNPDLVLFESFYQFNDYVISKELNRKKIPYIIIPRGPLTNKAQKIKSLKKQIANFLFFTKFARKARAIQYLTLKEKNDSGEKWNKTCFIIPNGIITPKDIKKNFNNDKIVFSFIGRLSIQHKGLDLLIEAIELCKEELRKSKCVFNIYGPDENGSKKKLMQLINEKNLNDLIFVKNEIHKHEKEDVLLNTDIFLLTSRFEGHPMGLIEALSYGVPVLVTEGSNMSEEVHEYNAGWTSVTESKSISNALMCILKRRDLHEKSINAKKLAQKYDWSNIAKETHEKIYNILK